MDRTRLILSRTYLFSHLLVSTSRPGILLLTFVRIISCNCLQYQSTETHVYLRRISSV